MKCVCCDGNCIKKGRRGKTQKYLCKSCGRNQQDKYIYKKYSSEEEDTIKRLNKFSMSISSIAGHTGFPKCSVQRKLYLLSGKLTPPVFEENNQVYEIDEMAINISGMKDIYLIYAMNRFTKRIMQWMIGPRTKHNLKIVVDAVLKYYPKRIYTDGLNSYPSLIPQAIHRVGKYFTYRIERNNLTLRTHIKRLTRNTLCYSKKIAMLDASLRIYLWT